MTRSNSLSLAVMVLTSITLFTVANYCGVGFTYDSYRYIDIAEQINKVGLLQAQGFNVKPPLYPLLIYWLGVKSIPIINIFCLTITCCVHHSFGYAVKTRLFRLLFWAISVFATPLYLVHSFAWTEPPFISTLLLAFYFIYIYQKHRNSAYAYASTVLLLLLPFIRFAGIFIIVPTLFVLFLQLPVRLKWRLVIITCTGTLMFSMWVWQFGPGFLRRWHTLINPITNVSFSRYTDNLDSYSEALSIWILPLPVYKPLRILLAIAGLAAIVVSSVDFFRKKRGDILLGIPFIFLCYYLLLHLVFDVAYYSAERYLTPMYSLLILSLFLQLDQKFVVLKSGVRMMAKVLLLAFLVYNIARTTKNVLFWNRTKCSTILTLSKE